MQGNTGRHHAVIGDGLVALEFVANIDLSAGDRLTIIGPKVAELGRGVAYADEPADAVWRNAFLLNSPVDGLDPDFTDWMRARWPEIDAEMRGRRPDWLASAARYLAQGDLGALNPPRRLYGDYLCEQAETVLARLQSRGVRVTRIAERVDRLEPDRGRFALTLASGRTVIADSVDVATGGPSNQRIEGDDGPNAFSCVTGREQAIADRLRPGVHVCCVGTNATMLDMLRLCQAVLGEGGFRLTAISPSAALPAPLYLPLPRRMTEPELRGPYDTAEAFLAAIRREMELAAKKGDGMAEMRGGFRKLFMERGLAAFLPDPGEARRVTVPLQSWLLGGTRDAIEDFDRLAKSGQTRTVTGRVSRIAAQTGGAVVHCEVPKTGRHQMQADLVINCAGPGRQFAFDPLTASLIGRGWVTVCPVSNGLEVGPKCQTAIPGLRHLSPATTVIGGEVLAMPLYDAGQLRQVLRGPFPAPAQG